MEKQDKGTTLTVREDLAHSEHDHDKGWTISIISSLLLNFVFLVVLVSGTILFVSISGNNKMADDLSKTYIEKVGETMEGKLDAFFTPIKTHLIEAQKWAKFGIFKPENLDNYNTFFYPILESNHQITSICTGDEKGFSNRLGYEGEQFLNRLTLPESAGASSSFYLWSKDHQKVKEWEEPLGYDPRKRDWYVGPMENFRKNGRAAFDEIIWTKPIVLQTSKTHGISASLPFEGPAGELFIMTFNIMFSKISEFTTGLRPTPHGKVFVFGEEQEVVGLPFDDKFATEESRKTFITKNMEILPKLRELNIPAISDAIGKWSKKEAIFSYESEGAVWWAQFRPYVLGKNRTIWIGIAVPTADFLEGTRKQQRFILLISLFALLMAIVMGVLLTRSYSAPLKELAQEAKEITTLDLTVRPMIHTHIAELRELADAHLHMKLALDSFSRYVPVEIVRELVKLGQSAKLGGELTPVTIMFCDIEGFTTIAETIPPDGLTLLLSEYFTGMMDVISTEKGTIDKMIGDAIMAFWGAPLEDPLQAARAVRACLKCRAFLAEFNERCDKLFLPRLNTRFGLSLGKVMVGNFGASYRMNYTALGDLVNLASRLEGTNKLYDTNIIATEEVKEATGDEFDWRLVDLVAVKGKNKPVRVFEVVGCKGHVSQTDQDFVTSYEAAFTAYQKRNFTQVAPLLQKALELRPGNKSVTRLLEAAKHFIAEPPPADWDGVTHMKTK